MTAPVEITEEQKRAATDIVGHLLLCSPLYERSCVHVAAMLAERDAAAEQRGADRERAACANLAAQMKLQDDNRDWQEASNAMLEGIRARKP